MCGAFDHYHLLQWHLLRTRLTSQSKSFAQKLDGSATISNRSVWYSPRVLCKTDHRYTSSIVQSRNKLLNPDTVQSIHGFLVRLSQQRPPSIDTLRASSIHRAIILVSGRATRWPAKLVDVCDEIIEKWETELGNLDKIRIDLYGPGERLHGIAEPRDLSRRVCPANQHRYAVLQDD